MLIKNIESYISSDGERSDQQKDVMSDIRYICKSCSLITESLQKGCDVMQMPNGDIIITEVKTVTFQYSWDEKKGKLVRVQAGSRIKKGRTPVDKSAPKIDEDIYEMDSGLVESL